MTRENKESKEERGCRAAERGGSDDCNVPWPRCGDRGEGWRVQCEEEERLMVHV